MDASMLQVSSCKLLVYIKQSPYRIIIDNRSLDLLLIIRVWNHYRQYAVMYGDGHVAECQHTHQISLSLRSQNDHQISLCIQSILNDHKIPKSRDSVLNDSNMTKSMLNDHQIPESTDYAE